MLSNLSKVLKFGSKQPVDGVAESIQLDKETDTFEIVTGLSFNKGRLDRWLDYLVSCAGSRTVFLFCNTGLVIWGFMAIPTHASLNWQAIIADVQALFTYVYDSLLMRQELNSYDQGLSAAAQLMSRGSSISRMLRHNTWKRTSLLESYSHRIEDVRLPKENWLDCTSTMFSRYLGSIPVLCAYCIGIFIWIGLGHYCNWSNEWQLYINTATAVLMIFQFTFLANIRERHRIYTEKCLNSVFQLDVQLEQKLRLLTNDSTSNMPATIPAPVTSKLANIIDFYVALVGTLIGIGILVAFMIIWIGLGPVMKWSDNWLLISGTYAGLIGMNDSFMFMNVYYRDSTYENEQFEKIKAADLDHFNILGIEPPKEFEVATTFDSSLSLIIGRFLAKDLLALSGTVIMVGLIIASSAMKWSLTAQIVSTDPPSIIEGFLMMALITGHNLADAKRRVDIHNLCVRRSALLFYVDKFSAKTT